MPMDNEEEYLMMSGIQHFSFCRRQWALIHIEQQGKENVLTAEGIVDHRKCHDESQIEKRNNIIIMRGMRVVSHQLKLNGICDVVEFHKDDNGIFLNKYEGKWIPVPIEYKHGHSKEIDADRLQLCAQGIALEEMLVCSIAHGYLYYKETNRREKVDFTEQLRSDTLSMSKEMNQYYQRGWTPKVKSRPKCKSCSLYEICLPNLEKRNNVSDYIDEYIRE